MERIYCSKKRGGYKHFSERERYKLEGYLEGGLRVKEISLRLNKHEVTIYREIQKGLIKRVGYELEEIWAYRANVAQAVYEKKVSNRERSLKIGKDKALEAHIRKKIIQERYSPDAVIGEIKVQGLEFEGMICVKTLYSYIDRGIFSGISNANLWEKRKQKKKAYRKIQRISLSNRNSRSIEERTIEINERQEYGHWEGDSVKGPKCRDKESLFTLTERKTREQIIFKLANGTQEQIRKCLNGLERRFGKLFNKKFKTITFDNGSEFLDWQSLEQSCLGKGKRTTIYFAHPFSAWERGTNENQNRMIRRFIPKGTSIAQVAEKDIKNIQNWMNNYPRKILGYKSANEMVLELTNDNRFLS